MKTFLFLVGMILPLCSMAQQASMQAIQIQSFGGPEVLELREIPQPVPGDDELLVRVHAAAINPVDTSVRAGRAGGLSGAQLPYVPGYDISGVVAAVGADVSAFEVGDEVYAMLDLRRGGGYAEYSIVKVTEAALKPGNVSHEEAASIPLVTLTAWQTLFDIADLKAGETVLIHAGAGGVGSVAVQLAKWRGARVIATASEYNHEFLREIGVDVPVDYRNERFEDYAQNVDVVLDTIGGETQVRSMAILKQGGTLVSIVGLTPQGRNPQRSDITVTSTLVQPSSAQLTEISQLIQLGIIRPIVNYRFPLQDASSAHEQSETRRSRGKIVLQIN